MRLKIWHTCPKGIPKGRPFVDKIVRRKLSRQRLTWCKEEPTNCLICSRVLSHSHGCFFGLTRLPDVFDASGASVYYKRGPHIHVVCCSNHPKPLLPIGNTRVYPGAAEDLACYGEDCPHPRTKFGSNAPHENGQLPSCEQWASFCRSRNNVPPCVEHKVRSPTKSTKDKSDFVKSDRIGSRKSGELFQFSRALCHAPSKMEAVHSM